LSGMTVSKIIVKLEYNFTKILPKENADVFSSEKNMTKIAIKILRASVVTQNVSDGPIIHIFFANSLWCIRLPKYETPLS